MLGSNRWALAVNDIVSWRLCKYAKKIVQFWLLLSFSKQYLPIDVGVDQMVLAANKMKPEIFAIFTRNMLSGYYAMY